MNGGKAEQIGAPRDIYERPRTAFAVSFLGKLNFFEGVVPPTRTRSALPTVAKAPGSCRYPPVGTSRPPDATGVNPALPAVDAGSAGR
jgi:ABC-type Fe3+/spermidine/putrescine transport system ATPase subunit